MERVQVLIDKLVQQKGANESAAQLLYTVQLLQAELAQLQQQQQKETLGSRKVSVVMPANFAPAQTEPVKPEVAQPAPKAETIIPAPQPIAQKEKETFLQPVAKAEEPAVIPTPAPVKEEYIQPVAVPVEAHRAYMEPVAQETQTPKQALQQKDLFGNEAYTLKRPAVLQTEEKREEPQPTYSKEVTPPHPVITPAPAEPQPFDAIAETPTLVQHIAPQVETPKEIHQLIAAQQPSLNDRLKEEKIELAHKLKDAPIKDLRKAIGINDRFLFLSELFRGDETMYERSIKTINSFHILQEAEYWMNRELKVKLGWNDNKDTVQHFYALVRRRFS